MPPPTDYDSAAAQVAQDNAALAKEQAVDPYANAAAQVASVPKLQLGASIQAGAAANPDTRARSLALANQMRLPVDVVERNLPEVERKARESAVDLDQLRNDHPELSDWLSNPDHAALSNDDLPVLRRIDAATKALSKTPQELDTPEARETIERLADTVWQQIQEFRALPPADGQGGPESEAQAVSPGGRIDEWLGQPQNREQLVDSLRRMHGLPSSLPQEGILGAAGRAFVGGTKRLASGLLADPSLTYSAQQDDLNAAKQSAPATFAEQAAGAIAGSVPAIATLAATRGRAAGLATANLSRTFTPAQLSALSRLLVPAEAGAISQAQSVQDRTQSPSEGMLNSILEGAFTHVGGAFEPFVHGIAGQGVKRLTVEALKEAGEEGATSASQDISTQVLGYNQGPYDFLQTLEAGGLGAVAGAAFAGAFGVSQKVADQWVAKARTASDAEVFAERLGSIADALADSKTNGRAPEQVADLLGRTLNQGDRFTFFSADDWRQGFKDPAAVAETLGIGKEYAESLATGTPLQVPTAGLLQLAAVNVPARAILEKARRSPEAQSAVEAAEFKAKSPGEIRALSQEAQQSAEAVKSSAPDQGAAVATNVEAQLIKAGVEESTAKTQAQVWGSAFSALGKRTGKDPLELFQKYQIRIKRELPKLLRGDKFDQVDAMLERLRTDAVPTDTEGEADPKAKGIRDSLTHMAATLQEAGVDLATMTNKQARAALAALVERDGNAEGTTREQSAAVVSPRGTALDMESLLRQWRKAMGDRTPVGGDKAYQELADAADAVDAQNGRTFMQPAGSSRKVIDQAKVEEARAKLTTEVRVTVDRKAADLPEAVTLPDGSRVPFDKKAKNSAERGRAAKRSVLDRAQALLDASHLIEAGLPDTEGRRGVSFDYYLARARTDQGVYDLLITVRNTPQGKFLHDIGLEKATAPDPAHAPGFTVAEEGVVGAAGSVESFTLNDLSKRQPPEVFEQPGKKSPRADIHFGLTGKTTIRLFQSADLSSFLHESGHLFLEVMGDLAAEANADPGIAADYQAVLKWLGAASRDEIGEDQHEQFARGFEAYLLEGRAPVPSLRSAFARIKAWMVAIYRDVANLNVTLSPEIRSVFDRLVAAEDEIDAAEQRAGEDAILPAEAFDSAASFDRYRLAVQAAADASRDRLQNELIADYRAEMAKAWKEQREGVRSEVADEIDARPVYQAIAALQNGTLPDGTRLPDEFQGIKLDREELVREWGDAVLAKLPGPGDGKANRGPHVYASEGGLPVNVVAKMFGFPDGVALVEAMIAAPDRTSLIETTTDAQIRASHPDPLTDGSLVDRANKAIASEERGTLLAMEMRALGRRTGQTPAPVEVLRQIARDTIDRQVARDLRPDKYRVAAAHAARQATEAAGKQDWRGAFIAKQREALNLEMYRASRDAKEAGDAGRAYLRRFDTLQARQRIGKAGGWEYTVYDSRGEVVAAYGDEEEARQAADLIPGQTYQRTSGYLEQIDGILEGFDLRRPSNRSLRKRESLRKWIERQQKDGEPVAIDPQVVDDLGNRNWNDLTVSEQVAAVDAVKNIEHLAQLKNKLLKAHREREFEKARDQVVSNILTHQPVARPDVITNDLPHRVKDAVVQFFNDHRKDSFLARKMDGHQAGGVSWDYFVRPRNEAASEQESRNAAAAMEFSALFDAWGKSAGSFAKAIPGTNLRLTLQERIALALNWGNAEGRQRVMMYLNRHGKNASDAQAVLDSLDDADWTLIDGIIAQINSHWSDIAALEQRVTGLRPEKVEALPFVTKGGLRRGGYYPIKYDSKKSNKAGDLQAATEAKELAAAAGARAQTRRGHTKIRAANVDGLALRLDFGVAGEHLAEVIHDLTHREMLIDQNRLLRDKAISLTIKEHHGRNALDQLVNTAADIALGDKPGRTASERFLRFMRVNSSAATFGYNATSALMNLTGIMQSLTRVGPGRIAWAAARVTRDAAHLENSATWVEGKSAFMANRANTFLRETADASRRVEAGGVLADVRRWGYYPMTQIQRAVDTITWMAAYDQVLAEANTAGATIEDAEAKAVSVADQVVIDTQGSGRIGDLSAFQRGGEVSKLLTAFYSYFNVAANLQGEAIGRTWTDPKDPGNWLRLGTTTMVVWALPAVLGGLIRAFLQGSDRDEKKRWENMLREQASYGAGMLVGLREASGLIEGGFGYSGPAGARGLGVGANLIGQIADAAAKGDASALDKGMLKAAISAGGILTGLPSTQANRLVDAVLRFEESGDDGAALRIALFGNPRRP